MRARWSMSPCSAADVEAVLRERPVQQSRRRACGCRRRWRSCRSAAPRISSRRVSRFSNRSRPVATSRWTIVAAVEAGRATSTLTGLCRNASASRWISGGMVAEKNRVWRVKGTIFTMRSISGMNPMSSMRSASSITRSSTPVSRSLPRSKWSSRRPGVAISTSTPRVILASWSPKDTPPISSAT